MITKPQISFLQHSLLTLDASSTPQLTSIRWTFYKDNNHYLFEICLLWLITLIMQKVFYITLSNVFWFIDDLDVLSFLLEKLPSVSAKSKGKSAFPFIAQQYKPVSTSIQDFNQGWDMLGMFSSDFFF